LLVAFLLFASLDNNPVVRLLAISGLSPSPIEKIFGVKSLFSGMTEGLYQVLHLNLNQALKANIFSPFVIPCLLLLVFKRDLFKIKNTNTEFLFFIGFISLSILVNVYN